MAPSKDKVPWEEESLILNGLKERTLYKIEVSVT